MVSQLLVFKLSLSIARQLRRFSSSRRIMRLSPVFIRDELNDEQNDALKCLAQSRPDALYVSSIKTANDLARLSKIS